MGMVTALYNMEGRGEQGLGGASRGLDWTGRAWQGFYGLILMERQGKHGQAGASRGSERIVGDGKGAANFNQK